MERALSTMQRGDMGLNAASKSYGVPKATLSRHEKCQNLYANGTVKYHGQSCTLTESMEEELVEHCLQLESMYFGLRVDDLRRLAFDLAEANGINHNFNREERMAGKKWYYAFMRRHPQLSLRKPENTSLARAQGFNKARVEAFFQMLGRIYDEEQLTPDRLYNMDETSLSTVQDGQKKIVGARGKRRIGAVVSNERGESTTCVVCMSASGSFVPPMLIYRRKRMKQELGSGAPPGTVLSAQEKGWMCSEGFCLWLKHFISIVKPTKDCKVVLVLDGHVTHAKNLEAINIAREAGVRMVSLPPHTMHRLQPLDVAFFAPLGTYYDESMRSWMRKHPGRAVTTWQVAELFGEAYGKAASVGIAMSGFRASGLWPLNLGVFCDADFSAAAVTDVTRSVTMTDSGTDHPASTTSPSLGTPSHDTFVSVIRSSELDAVNTDATTEVSVLTHDQPVIHSSSPSEPNLLQADIVSTLPTCTSSDPLPVTEILAPADSILTSSESSLSQSHVTNSKVQVPLVPADKISSSAIHVNAEPVFASAPADSDQHDDSSAIAVRSFYNRSKVSTTQSATSHSVTERTLDVESTVNPPRQIVHVSDMSPLPIIQQKEKSRVRKRTTQAAADLTSTPYKQQLEATPTNRKREARKRLTLPSSKPVNTKQKCRKKNPQKNTDSKDKAEKHSHEAESVVACHQCGFAFGDVADPLSTENWIKCTKCPSWFHDSCSEVNGLLDDDVFLCADCVNSM